MNKILTSLLPLLLAACGVSLPQSVYIDAGGQNESSRPVPRAEGLIRTAQGECLDIHGDDKRSLIATAATGRRTSCSALIREAAPSAKTGAVWTWRAAKRATAAT